MCVCVRVCVKNLCRISIMLKDIIPEKKNIIIYEQVFSGLNLSLALSNIRGTLLIISVINQVFSRKIASSYWQNGDYQTYHWLHHGSAVFLFDCFASRSQFRAARTSLWTVHEWIHILEMDLSTSSREFTFAIVCSPRECSLGIKTCAIFGFSALYKICLSAVDVNSWFESNKYA